MPYVDGFVIPMPKKSLPAYRRIAAAAGKIWMSHGALEYRECVGDDLKTQMGLSFPKLTKAKSSETIVFAWIVYRSKSHRNKVNTAVMNDPHMAKLMNLPMTFDVKRMSYGGFKAIVDL